MALTIDTTTTMDGQARIAVAGEVDVSCAHELRTAIDAALAAEGAGDVEVDLAQVPYIDSTGIGVLVGAVQKAADAGVTLRVSNVQRNVRRVLDMLGIASDLGLGAPAE